MAEAAVPPPVGQRIIIKQGYLKKISNSNKLRKTWKKPERRWCVFGFIQDVSQPYLEYYPSEESIFTGIPLKFIILTHVQHVQAGFLPDKEGYAFTVIAADKEHTLMANNRTDMMDWVRTIQSHLLQSNIIQEGGENPYVIEELPSRLRPAISTERQSMPLPPLPAVDEDEEVTSLDTRSPSERPLPPLPDSPVGSASDLLVSAGDDLDEALSSLPEPPPVPPSLDETDSVELLLPSRSVSPPLPPRSLTSTPDRPPPLQPQSQTVKPPKPPRPKTLPASVAYGTEPLNVVLNRQSPGEVTGRARPVPSSVNQAANALADLAKQNKPLPAVPLAREDRPLPPVPPVEACAKEDKPLPPPPPSDTSAKEDKPLPPTPPVYAVSSKQRSSTLPIDREGAAARLSTLCFGENNPVSEGSTPQESVKRTSAVPSFYVDRPLPPPPVESDSASAASSVTPESPSVSSPKPQPSTSKKTPFKPPRPPPPNIRSLSQDNSSVPKGDCGTHLGCPPISESTLPPRQTPVPAPRISRSTSGPAISPVKPNKRPVPTPRRGSQPTLKQSHSSHEQPLVDLSSGEQAQEQELNNNTLKTSCDLSEESCSAATEQQPPPYCEKDPNCPVPYSEVDPFKEEEFTIMYTSTGHRLDMNFASNGVLQTSSGEPLELDFDFDPRAESPQTNGRHDLNFYPGATVVDMFEEQRQQQSHGDDEQIYEPLWNKNGTPNTSGTIPPPPAPTPRRPPSARSQSVDVTGTNQPQPLMRRTSRQLSVVSGMARAAGDDIAAGDQAVVASARSPGEADPKSDAVVDLPGLPKSERSVKRRTVSLPEPQPLLLPPPSSPRSPQAATSPAAASPQQPAAPPAVTEAVRQLSQTTRSPSDTSEPNSEPMNPLVTPVRPQNEAHRPITVGGAVYLTPGPGATSPGPGVEDLGPFTGMSDKMLEAMGLIEDAVGGWNAPPPDDGAPPPYMPRSVLNRGTQKSLKQSQVELLQKEIDHVGGVKVTLRRTDCHHTLILVDAFGSVWLAGMNQKARPFLHNAFHIGDQVLSINLQVVENAKMAYKLIKNSGAEDKVIFIIKRVPKARVFAMRRDEDGQDLGIRREGGTAEITDVVPFSVASRHGLPAKAPTFDGTNLCQWWLTEINSRPLNLMFKGDQIEHRLNAVGRDISIMVQPMDFIMEIRAQLKLVKNYKDFLLQ